MHAMPLSVTEKLRQATAKQAERKKEPWLTGRKRPCRGRTTKKRDEVPSLHCWSGSV
jgi:hypothetical protein